MIALLEHHLRRAENGQSFNAIRDCHVVGMDSIMLHDEPGNRVRMFFARPGHDMHKNRIDGYEPFSLAIHPHHFDITMCHLFGEVRNDVYAMVPNADGPFAEHEYKSVIFNGLKEGALVPTGERFDMHRIQSTKLGDVGRLHMPAHALHTVYVPQYRSAAWLVMEGEEDPNYRSRCWTNNKDPSLDGLYNPMDHGEVIDTLRKTVEYMGKPSA